MECVNISRFQGILLILLFALYGLLPELAVGVPRRHYCENMGPSSPIPTPNPTSTTTPTNPPASSPSTLPSTTPAPTLLPPPTTPATQPPPPPPPAIQPPPPPPPAIQPPSPPPPAIQPPPPPPVPVKIVGNYPIQGNGTEGKLGVMDYYESPQIPGVTPTRALIALHDDNGFQGPKGNVRQFVDVLSGAFNFRTIMPSFTNIGAWRDVKPGVEAAIEHIKTNWSITSIGIFGWCDGGEDAYEAAQEVDLTADLKAAVLLHPRGIVSLTEAHLVKIPLYIIISDAEDDLFFADLISILRNNNIPTGYENHTAHHGYAASYGDFSDAKTATEVEEAINSTATWLNKYVI